MTKIKFNGNEWQKALPEIIKVLGNADPAKKYAIEIKEHHDRRSLDANALFWLFCGKLAEVTSQPLDLLYQTLIRNLGGNFDVICIQDKAVDAFKTHWASNGIGWFCDELPSKVEGCTNLVCFYGSSVYDTKQMSRLIDSLLQECEQFDIDTRTLAEIAITEGVKK